MLGAITGDIIGSIYEGRQANRKDFSLFGYYNTFTDDSVLTVAIADAILSGEPYGKKLKEYYRLYPGAGYGGAFRAWASSSSIEPYNSYGNGSAMRVSPVAYACNDIDLVLKEAARSAACTHNHPEGVKGAQAIGASIFLAKKGSAKEEIQNFLIDRFDYDLSPSVIDLHLHYKFDVTCQGSVPQAIVAFLASDNFEDAIRNAIFIGGDSDTLACMAGGIAEAFYGGVPMDIKEKVYEILDSRLLGVVDMFLSRYLNV